MPTASKRKDEKGNAKTREEEERKEERSADSACYAVKHGICVNVPTCSFVCVCAMPRRAMPFFAMP